MREEEARRVVERLLADDEWPDDEFSQRARGSIEELAVEQQADGQWSVRVLFSQGPYRLGWIASELRSLTEGLPCSPEAFASDARMFGIEEPHGPAWGEPDSTGRLWLRE